jgi:hypothetical protein
VALALENYEVHTIAYLAQISRPLSEEYIKLWHNSSINQLRREELEDLKKKHTH